MCQSVILGQRKTPRFVSKGRIVESIVETKLGNKELVDRRKIWIKALKIGKKVSDHMRVCSLHFSDQDYFHKGGFC